MVVNSLLHLATLFLVASLVQGQSTNVSVDDTDSRITYFPSASAWTKTEPTNLDFPWGSQSTHSLTSARDHPGAQASLTFTGVAVYYFSPKWPYPVNSFVSIDGDPGICVDLFDPLGVNDIAGHETLRSAPVWFREGLANTQHTVTVSACPDGQYIIVDGFIYTTRDTTSTSIPSSSTSTKPTTTLSNMPVTTSTSAHSTKQVIAIAVGSALGGAVLLGAILIVVIFLWMRGRDRAKVNNDLPTDLPVDNVSYAPVPQMPVVQAHNQIVPVFAGQPPTSGLYDPYIAHPQTLSSNNRSSFPSTTTSGDISTQLKYPQLPEL